MGQSRGDTWSQGQGSGHGRLVRVLNGSGAWRAVVPSFLLRDGGRRCMGSPARRFDRFCGNGGLPGGATCLAATGPGCSARGCGEWASMAGNVPAAAPALGLPFFWGGGRGTDGSAKAAQLPPCQQRTELPFTSSHGSDDGLARNTVRLVLPRPTLHSSPGRPPPFPARGRWLQQPGDRAWSLLEGHSLPGASAPYPHAALACFLGGRGCPYPVSPLLSWQRKAGVVVTAAAIREK